MFAQLVVIAGPSGSGQSTVINSLLLKHQNWSTVYSYTTRKPRINEDDSKKYYYISKPEFLDLVDKGEIVEHQEYAGNFYGTSKQSLTAALAKSEVVILSVQITGLKYFKTNYPGTVGIYLRVDPKDALTRMNSDHRRDAMPEDEKEKRLNLIRQLNANSDIYDYQVESKQGRVESVVDKVESIVINVIG